MPSHYKEEDEFKFEPITVHQVERLVDQAGPEYTSQVIANVDPPPPEEEKPWWHGVALETVVGIGADLVTAPLLATPVLGARPLYYGLNYGIGYGTNVLAQKLRGETEINQGEAHAAGGFQTIPLGTTLKGAKGLRRAIYKGAGAGLVGRQVEVGIDEGRALTPGEAISSAGVGAAFGGTFKGIQERKVLKQQLKNQIQKADESLQDFTGKWIGEQVQDNPMLATGGGVLPPPRGPHRRNVVRKTNPDFVDKQFYRMKQWGMDDGVFDYFQWKHLKETKQKGETPSRAFAEFFQSVEQSSDNYKGVVTHQLPEFKANWEEFLKARDINPKAIQLHHIALLQDSMGLYHNVQFDSDEWWDITATLLKNNVRPGTTNWSKIKGKDNPNLKYVLGYSGQEDMPHGVAHKLYRDELDKKGFFSNEEILKMSIDPKYRIKKVKAFAKIVNRSEDILEQAMKVFNALNPKGDQDLTATVNFLNTLNRDGQLPTTIIEGKYQVPQMKQLILDIQREMDNLPPTIRTDTETFEYWLLNKLLDYYGGANPNLIYGVKRRMPKKRYGKKP